MSDSGLSLPTELVRKVLIGCLLDPEFYTDPFDLARVCRQWRGVICAENSLWETLHMTWIGGPSVHYYLLHPCMRIAPFRAQAQNLGTSRYFLQRAQDWFGRSGEVNTKLSLSLETDGTEPQSLLPTLFTQYRNRLRRLSLVAPLNTLARFLRCLQRLHDEQLADELLLPHLEFFEVRDAHRSTPGTTLRGLRRIDLCRWSALKSLKLQGSRSSGDHPALVNCSIVSRIPYSQLVSLYLEDRKLTFSGARNILDRCCCLEEFSAIIEQEDSQDEITDSLPFHPTTLSNLRIMHLYFLSMSNACGLVARFFGGLYTPTLKELIVDAQYAIDESSSITSMLSHMLRPSQDRHPLEALTLILDIHIDSVLCILNNLLNLRYLRLCAPKRGKTYLRCGYISLLDILAQRTEGQGDLPLIEEIYVEDNTPPETHRLSSLALSDGKIDPDVARHLGLFAIQYFVESRCNLLMHIRCISVTWKNVRQHWPPVRLDTGKYNCPYNQPTLRVKDDSVAIIVKCLPHKRVSKIRS